MRNALTAFICAASLCALATAASAQDATMYGYPPGTAPTIPSTTGAPLYSYHHTRPQPAAVGSCQIVAGNRVCSAMPTDGGYAPGGPVAAVVGAPMAILAAPFGMFGASPAPYGSAMTYAPATGTPAYSYEGRVGPQPGWVGHCDLISGNRVCFP